MSSSEELGVTPSSTKERTFDNRIPYLIITISTQLKRRLGEYRWRHSLIEAIGILGWPSRFGRGTSSSLWSQTDRRRVYQNVWNIDRFDDGIRRSGWRSLLILGSPIELFPRHHVRRSPRFFSGGKDFFLGVQEASTSNDRHCGRSLRMRHKKLACLYVEERGKLKATGLAGASSLTLA